MIDHWQCPPAHRRGGAEARNSLPHTQLEEQGLYPHCRHISLHGAGNDDQWQVQPKTQIRGWRRMTDGFDIDTVELPDRHATGPAVDMWSLGTLAHALWAFCCHLGHPTRFFTDALGPLPFRQSLTKGCYRCSSLRVLNWVAWLDCFWHLNGSLSPDVRLMLLPKDDDRKKHLLGKKVPCRSGRPFPCPLCHVSSCGRLSLRHKLRYSPGRSLAGFTWGMTSHLDRIDRNASMLEGLGVLRSCGGSSAVGLSLLNDKDFPLHTRHSANCSPV